MDLTTEELKKIIEDVVEEKLTKVLDPYYGLDLREELVKELETSMSTKERIAWEDVKKKIE